MTAYLLDTHTWAWTLAESWRLSTVARNAIVGSATMWVSPASIYEIVQKVRLGKWPSMMPILDELVPALDLQKARAARLDADICFRAAEMTWSNRDPFDRLIAATALNYGVPIISMDKAFDGIVPRIW